MLQEPGSAYTVASDTITFASAPTAGTDCWILLYTEFGGALGPIVDLTVSNNLTIGNELHGPANFVIDPATIGDNTGTVEIKGNLTVQGTQTTVNSTTVDLDHLSLGDGEIANFGTDNDLRIYHSGNVSRIYDTSTNLQIAGSIVELRNSGTNEVMIAAYEDDRVELYYDDSKKLETTSTGVTITGTVTADGLSLGDNETANFGNDNDLQIRHNNSNSIIEHNGTGNLYIQTTGDNEDLYIQSADNVLIRSQGSEDGIRVIGNGAVELYYNNAKKLETTSTGVDITDTLNVSGLTTLNSLQVETFSTFNGNTKHFDGKYANFGNSTDLQIVHDGANSVIQNTTGQFFIDNNASGGDLFLRANDDVVIRVDGNDTVLTAQTGGIDVTGHTETDTLRVSGIATFTGSETNFEGLTKIKITSDGQALQLINTSNANNAYVDQRFNIDGHSRASIRGQIFGANLGGLLRFYTAANSQVLTERAVIDYNGRFGINVTSPTETLDVGGTTQTQQLNVTGVSTFANTISVAETIQHTGDTNTSISFPSNDYIRLTTSGSSRLNATPNGYILLGTNSEPSGGDAHARNARLVVQGRIGNTADSGRLNLQRGSSTSNGSSIGSITFTDNSNNAYARIETIADAAPGANDFPGAIVFSTTPDGSASPTESLRITSAGYVSIPDDSGRFTAGSSNDLQIYHDGSNSYVEDVGTGALIMKGSTVRIRSTTNENMLSASQNGAISLYYDNSVKLGTTSTGIDVTGKTDTDTLNVSGLSTLQGTLEFDSTLQSYDPAGGGGSDTSTSAAIALPSGKQIVGVDDGYIRSLLSWSNSSNIIIGQQNTSKIQGIQLKPGTNAGVGLHYGGSGDNLKFRTTSTGVDVLGGIDVEGGDIVFDSDTESNFLYISRQGSTSNEFTRISRGDTVTTFLTKNDEESSTVRFRILNTDTEAGGGANANARNIDLISDQTNARIVIDGNTVWHAGNDGSGSGLDADTLDGQQGSYYTNAANLTGTLPAIDGSSLTGIIASNATTLDNLDSSQFLRSDVPDEYRGGTLSINSDSNTGHYVGWGMEYKNNNWRHTNANSWGFAHRNSGGIFDIHVAAEAGTADSVVTYKTFRVGGSSQLLQYDGNNVWHAGNDGSGSGLDADTVDGIQASSFLRSNADDQFTGTITASSDGSNPIILVKGSGPNFIRFASDSSGTVDADSIDFVYRSTPNTLGFERSSDGTTFWTTDADTGVTNFNYTPTVSGSSIFNASNLNAGTIPDARIPDVITPATRVQTAEIRGNGTQLVLNAGEAAGKFSGQTAEKIYLNSEGGTRISTPTGGGNFESGYVTNITEITGQGIFFHNGTTRIGEITTQDTTWLRINQTTAKNIYTPRYIRADGGLFVDGTAKGINGSGNFIGGTIAGASDVTDANTANTVVKRNGSSDINCRLVRQSYQNQSTISGGIVYRINNSNDNYLRVCNSPSAIRTFLGVTATGSDGNYLRANATDTATGTLTFNGLVNIRNGLDFADGDFIRMGSSDDWTATFNNNNWLYINQKGNGIIFQDNGTGKMVLEDSGIFRPHSNNQGAIGTTTHRWNIVYAYGIRSQSQGSPGHNNSTTGYALSSTGAGYFSRSGGEALYCNRNQNGGIVRFGRSGSEKGQIVMNTNSVSYQTTSDYRLKENVVALENGIERVKQLKPYRFNFIDDPNETLDGFLAHEAQEVVHECASGTKDEMKGIGTLTEWDGTTLETDVVEPDELTWEETITDEEGNETTQTRTRTWTQTGTQPVHQGIDQAKLVPLLTAALQEAITKIEQLEARITQLEST